MLDTLPKVNLKDSAWSWTRLSSIRTCPYQYYLKFVVKQQVDRPVVFDLGDRISKATEEYVKHLTSELGVTPALDASIVSNLISGVATESHRFLLACYTRFKFIVEGHSWTAVEKESHAVFPEYAISIDKEGNQVSWFSKRVYFRAKLDRLDFLFNDEKLIVKVIDYKIGNSYLGLDQVKLYSSILTEVFKLRNIPHTYWLGILHLYSGDVEFEETGDTALWEETKAEIEVYSTMDVLPPTPGMCCNSCEFSAICRYAAN